MNDDRATQPDPPGSIQDVYGRAYFHGVGSGYPKEGYGAGHQDWNAWIEIIRFFRPGGVLIDLGCAYGFLPLQARPAGYLAFGLDISDFALRQEAAARPFLAQADLQRLPIADRSADVVCLFDVLEHLPRPEAAIAEAARIIKKDGLIVGATPDPIFFTGDEPTHCHERPPSFWLAALGDLGLDSEYRFSVEAYNFQFIACLRGGPASVLLSRFKHDCVSETPDFVASRGEVQAKPRFGWTSLQNGERSLGESTAALYLHNPGQEPLCVGGTFRVSSTEFTRLRVRWNSLVLEEFLPVESKLTGRFEIPPFILPSGGHHLFFETSPSSQGTRIGSIELAAERAEAEELVLGLPFDLYQRYRMAADVCARLNPTSVLDFGGHLGDRDGHLGTFRDFLAAAGADDSCRRVLSSDLRQCDHPDHIPAGSGEPVFEELEFDLVVCLDVLEHFPPDERPGLLAQLDRLAKRWILLSAPFASEEVEKGEALLRKGLMSARDFLLEHERFGLPDLSSVREFAADKGYALQIFPNGWLPRWIEIQALTQHYFSLDDYQTIRLFNTWSNRSFYESDRRSPSYRQFLVISKQPAESEVRPRLQDDLRLGTPEDETRDQPLFLRLQERVEELNRRRHQARSAAHFLLNEREKHIELLLADIEALDRLNRAPLHKIALRRLRGQE